VRSPGRAEGRSPKGVEALAMAEGQARKPEGRAGRRPKSLALSLGTRAGLVQAKPKAQPAGSRSDLAQVRNAGRDLFNHLAALLQAKRAGRRPKSLLLGLKSNPLCCVLQKRKGCILRCNPLLVYGFDCQERNLGSALPNNRTQRKVSPTKRKPDHVSR